MRAAGGSFYGEWDEGNFLLEFAEGGLVHADAAQVVADDGVFVRLVGGIRVVGGRACVLRLEYVDVEGNRLAIP